MKSLKNLLIPLAILLALIIVVVIVIIVKPKDNEEEVTQDYQLVLYKPEDVSKVQIERKDKDDLVLSNNSNKWTIEGSDPSMSYSDDAINLFLSMVLDFKATSKLNVDSPNLEDYGLADNYLYKINITANDGSVRVITLGNDAYDASNCYVTVDNMDGIYMITTVKKAVCEYDYINFYSSVKLGIDYSKVEKIILDRKTDDYPFTIIPEETDSGYGFNIVEPVVVDSGDNLNLLLTGIKDLEISSFVELDDEKKKEVGLDDPSYHLSFVMKDGSSKDIYLSDMKDDVFYGYGSVSDNYFMISSQQIENLTYPTKDLIGNYVYSTNVGTVKKIIGQYEDLEFTFDITATDSISSDDAQVFLDGRDAKIFSSSGRCYAAIFFESMALLKIGDIEPDAVPQGSPVLTIKYFNKDFTNDVLTFIQRDESSYYVMKNDEYTGFFVYANELFKNGGTDTYAYGILGAYDLLTTAINDNLNGIYDIPAGE
ncbi:MAG: DUF4340 domain-containing protein [Clostridiales bacterium]|nr:DUF4340 domain-containing protein [Clostridiales bacterium]